MEGGGEEQELAPGAGAGHGRGQLSGKGASAAAPPTSGFGRGRGSSIGKNNKKNGIVLLFYDFSVHESLLH